MAHQVPVRNGPSGNVFLTIYKRSRAVSKILLHLLVYNYAMLALATSLPTFTLPKLLDLSVQLPHFLSLIFPLTAAFITYLSASYIFIHVNLYAGKHLIPVPRLSQSTEDAYPILSAAILVAVCKEVVGTVGLHHAWFWALQLVVCCIIEAAFLFSLITLCSKLFPKFGQGMGPVLPEDSPESLV